jgi:hypothetical protein
VNLAYIVSAYKLPEQLSRLVKRLATDTSRVLIHVDRKTDEQTYRRMVTSLARFDNVSFVQRHRCDYGGFGHVRATITGLDELIRRRVAFDYVILLTGQDYPIKSNEQITAFFRKHQGASFIDHFTLPTDGWEGGGLDRIESWHVRVRGQHFRIRGRPRLRLTRTFPAGLRPFGGSSYWSLSRECSEWVYKFLRRRPSYVRFFKYVDVPDEMFFQTIVLNSPLRATVVNDDLRYLEWRNPVIAGGPAVLGKGDLGKLARSPKLFARKFDVTQDEEILDLIDSRFLER